MRALDRKLLRDLRTLWAQAATICLVVASGLGGFVGSLSTVESISDNRDDYYAQARFADVFSYARRAPEAAGRALADIPGVSEVQTSLVFPAQIDVRGVSQPLTGRMVGTWPSQWRDGIDRLDLRSGRWPAPGAHEVLVSEAFAAARHLRPGSEVHALMNGKRQRLTIAGVALSPEYVFAAAAGGMPDDASFGVFWIDRTLLEAAYGMKSAFNAVAVKLRPGASEPGVVAAIDDRLGPYGSRGAFGRAEQPSDKAVSQEIHEQRVFGVLLPAFFLAVAVFILNVVLGRQVTTQREQIAGLKALGYDDWRIALHYVKLALLIVLAGIVLGAAIGDVFGRAMTRIYTDFFRFPTFRFDVARWAVAAGGGLFVAAALAGAWGAVRSILRLAPAQAMRPPAPAAYRRVLGGRGWLARHAGPAPRMVVRNVVQRSGRALLTTAGIASAVAILVAGTWWGDALDYLIELEFSRAQPGDVYVGFVDPVAGRIRYELASAPGVLQAETRRTVAIRAHAGHRSYRTVLQGIDDESQLWRLVDVDGRVTRAPAGGVIVTDRLARILGVRAGDTLRLEFLEGRRVERDFPVVALSGEPMGLSVYMGARELERVAADGPAVNSAALFVDPLHRDDLFSALKRMPKVAGVFVKTALIDYFRATSARNILFFTSVLTAFAAAIAVGVAYNSARIALAERAWELATMRVLGLSLGEVAAILLGELAVELVVAVPLGFLGGRRLAEAMIALMASENFRIPAVILPRTYAYAAFTMVAAAAASAWLVQRRLARLDLIGVLKTRE